MNSEGLLVELSDQLLPYTTFKRSFEIISTDQHLSPGFGSEIGADRGDWILIKARTGEGKTTLLRKVAGIDSSGYSVKIDGKSLSEDRKWHPRIGYVSQVPYLIGNSIMEMISGKSSLSVEEEFLYRKCLSITSLEEFGEDESSPVNNENLSGGQRKQIALARALYARPQILILDEVTAGMDQILSASILDRLKSLDTVDVVIMTTHEEHFDNYFNKLYLLMKASQSSNRKP